MCMCFFFFLCITYFLLDTRLVLAYMLSTNLLCKKKKKKKMYFNARSVFRKLDNLKLVCAIHEPDVICIIRPVGRGVRGGSSEPPF